MNANLINQIVFCNKNATRCKRMNGKSARW